MAWRSGLTAMLVGVMALFSGATKVLAGMEGDGSPRVLNQPLRLAMSGAFQPFSTTDAQGNLVGFDADIAQEIAQRMRREPVLIQTDWAGIQAGLQSGKFDLICGSMAITSQRLQTLAFSLPYYVSGAQIFVRSGRRNLDGARIGVTEDSTYAHYIREHPARFPRAKIVQYGSEAEIVAAMSTGKIDAFLSDLIVGSFYIKKGGAGDIVPLGDLLYHEACGITARQDSPRLVHEVNQALLALIQDGTYSRIYRQWVGVEPDLERLLGAWGDYAKVIPGLNEGAIAGDHPSRPSFIRGVQAMLPLLAKGAALTIVLSAITAVLAFITGAFIGIGTCARNVFIQHPCNGYINVVRGTPLLVQLFLSYYALATVVNGAVGFELIRPFGAALIALVINTTAYNAETLRGGINAVEKGQWDAAASLGMSRAKIMKRVVLPQAFTSSLPSLGNNLVVLIKDTSLVGAITLIELTYTARNVVFQTGRAFMPFLLAGVFYLAIISTVTLGMRYWERHLRRSYAQLSRI